MGNKAVDADLKIIKLFFLLSHLLPFLTTTILMILEKSFYISNQLYSNLIYFSLLSPTFAAICILYFYYSSKERIAYWHRLIDYKRISSMWYFVIFSLPIFIRIIAAIFALFFSSTYFQFYFSPEMTFSYALLLLFFGPIPEEMGWRGIVLPKLMRKYGFNQATIFLGFMWAIWHLPLFFVEGTYQYQLVPGSSLFWNFMFGIYFTTFIYSMIYIKTNQSILAAILFHFMDNFSGEAFMITDRALLISTFVRGIIAFYIFLKMKNAPFGSHIQR
jgi:membrane protease YdiL (CAAX protease family)